MSPAEQQAVRGFIAASADQAQAESDFVRVGWELMLLRELRENPEGLSASEVEERRQRISARLGATLAALAEPARTRLLDLLGEPLRLAGYVPAVSVPAEAFEPLPIAPARPRVPGLAPSAYFDALRRCQAAMREKDWRAAEAAARLAEALAPSELGACAFKAAALSMQDRHDEAVAEIKTALRLGPQAFWLQNVAALVFNRACRYDEAQKAAESSIAARPGRGWAWYQLAYAQAGQGDRAASLLSLEQAARMDAEAFGPRERRARAAGSALVLAAFFAADPAIETLPLLSGDPAASAWRRWLIRLAWPAAGAAVLLLFFLLRRPMTAAVVRTGLAAAGTPLPSLISGMPPTTGAGLSLPGLPAGYRVLRQIGSGGMGAVYEAEDLSLQRRVALKRMRDEIRSDPHERDRFLKEARLVARMSHPNILNIHAIVEHQGEVFLVFEFLEGRTVDVVVHEQGRLDVAQARAVLAPVCSALGYAHAQGVIHRDLKPPNIMITRDNHVKVMDFGVARQAHAALSRLTALDTVAGTPPYMAPESETGTARPESDLYSLAVCLYEMLTGERPFDGTNAGMLFTKMNMTFVAPSRKVPGLPEALDAFFTRALQAEPERRPRSAAAFLDEFLAAAGLAPARPV